MVVLGSGDVVLDGPNSSDADDDTLTYTWHRSSRPAGSRVNLNQSGKSPSTSFTPDVAGAYNFDLTVSDGALGATDYVVITVRDNSAPIANAGEDRVVISDINRTSARFTIDASLSSDSDSDALTCKWELIVLQRFLNLNALIL